ncbi:MAG: GHKL domain-containing protein, partial [Wujia sp.]
KCHIRMRNTGLALEMWEVIDIIGILLDNAFECTREQEKEVMNLEIVETDKGILIKTINPSPYVPYTEISKMFSLGYSTKGKNRGIGLHTVRKLVKKCNGEIVTGNQTYDDDNYFELQVMIPICF